MKYYVGVDLGGTNLRAAVFNPETAETISFMKTPTLAYEGHDAVIQRMATLVDAAIQNSGLAKDEIGGVGVGIPGRLDLDRGLVIYLPNLHGHWQGVPLPKTLSDYLHLPVAQLNDARSMALGEWKFGAGRGVDTVACFTLGTGIGGGLIINGRLNMTMGGTAGEFGHQIVEPNGIPCGCGGRGCLEMYVSAPAITARAAKAILHGHTTQLDEMVEHDLNRLSVQIVAQAARDGDPIAREIFQTAGAYLGLAAANVFVITGAHRMVYGGGVAAAGDLLFPEVRKTLQERVHLLPADQVELVNAELGDRAGLIGAALWAAQAVSAYP